ncbi:hypothetical protein LAZ67_10002380 [Cordylochernes scorpioides]|uniref:Uncharacterized protein n=1 Tax=Cordylochernes scorpioides TaxID=51811 RepID=A0ABY6KZE5_9ARAC|nr:hypothetical protein LAZ67_10002380 [Cordylochernes scorpioides]
MTPRQVEEYFAACDMQRLGKDLSVWANINPTDEKYLSDKTREDLDEHCKMRIANIQDAISHLEECLTDELKNGLPEVTQLTLTLLQDLCSNSTVLDQAVTNEKSAIVDQDIYINCMKEVKVEDDKSIIENISIDKPRSGRPSTATNPENEDKVDDLIRYRKICSNWVPRKLTPDQHDQRAQLCQELQNLYEAQKNNYF